MSTREADLVRKPAAQSWLLRLRTLPGHGRNPRHRQAPGSGPMQDNLRPPPVARWLTTETMPVTRHLNDPAVDVPVP